jgi:hypothetical protein
VEASLMRILAISLLIFLMGFHTGCGKKKNPVRDIVNVSQVDLLPSVVNVRYREGDSGVDTCKDCHSTIVDEWKSSLHSQSTVSKSFYKASDKYGFEDCMKCHAPQTFELGDNRPVHRSWKHKEGITCASCHVRGNGVLGPFNSIAPHKTRVVDGIRTVDACAPCHQNTHQDWKSSPAAEENAGCIECHMPAVRRLIADYSKHLYKPKDGRSHKLEVNFTDLVDLRLTMGKLNPDQVTFSVTSKAKGHTLPTGIYGEVNVFVQLSILDRDKVIFFREEKLSARDKTALKPGETRSFFYNFKTEQPKSYLVVGKVFFSSPNYTDDVKLGEVKQYLYQEQ